ncbi:MAG TPA: hypothetical protein DCZ72_10870 [Armatimonadetes bacterium]|nr:hypothetical protein [Armatimonadota bacterium]
MRMLLIASTYSLGGRGHRFAPELALRLGADLALAQKRGAARALAGEAIGRYDRLLVGGGDGLLHEVANALMSAPAAERPTLGLLPLGTGNDVARNLGVGELGRAIAAIEDGQPGVLDVFEVRCHDAAGRPHLVYSVLNVGFGYGVEVIRRASPRLKATAGGAAAYAWGTLATLATWDSPALTLSGDHGIWRGRAFFASLCNGARECGGSLCLAPGARLDDGLAHLVVIPRLPRALLATRLPLLADGSFVEDQRVRFWPVRWLRATAERQLGLQADGELVGYTPAEVRLVPGALSVLTHDGGRDPA